MSKHSKKIVLLGMDPSNELAFLMSVLSRNGFEFVTVKSGKKYHRLMEAFGIPRTSLRVYKPRVDKLSLAIIEPTMYPQYSDKLQKCPVIVDAADLQWYKDQIGVSHDGRIPTESFNWLKMKALQLSSHISLMEYISSCRP